jgi:TonB family protein
VTVSAAARLIAIACAAASLLPACGSRRPTDSDQTTEPLGEPADAGVSIGRPSSGDAGAPELPARTVPFAVLDKLRTGGTREVAPDDADRSTLTAAGKNAVAVVKLCVKSTGAISKLQLIKSSGTPSYDDKILREMKNWTFGPITVDGQPADACSPVTFAFRPSSSPPAVPPTKP